MKQHEMFDGETIMVIGPRAKTRTGRRVGLSAAGPFVHPDKREFASFMGYMALSRRIAQGESFHYKQELEFRRAVGERAESMFSQCASRRVVDNVMDWSDLYLGHLLALHRTPELRAAAIDDLGLPEVTVTGPAMAHVIRSKVKQIVDDSIDPDLYEFDHLPPWQADALVKFYGRLLGQRQGTDHG